MHDVDANHEVDTIFMVAIKDVQTLDMELSVIVVDDTTFIVDYDENHDELEINVDVAVQMTFMVIKEVFIRVVEMDEIMHAIVLTVVDQTIYVLVPKEVLAQKSVVMEVIGV